MALYTDRQRRQTLSEARKNLNQTELLRLAEHQKQMDSFLTSSPFRDTIAWPDKNAGIQLVPQNTWGNPDSDLNSVYKIEERGLENQAIEYRLDAYKELVNHSRSMLELEYGWDEEGAEKIDPSLFEKSSAIIFEYIRCIFAKYQSVLPNPRINPVPDGTIDFEWYNEKARLLINFRFEKNVIMAYFYGDLLNNTMPIKGSVPIDKVYSHLMEWMINL